MDFLTKYTALIYLFISLLWIFSTDLLINKIGHSTLLFEYLQYAKGLIFAVVTTILIHFIIKKHKAHKEAEEKENELSILINSMPDFVSFKDGKGRWLKVNDFGKALYSLENVDYVGKTDEELAEMVPFFKEVFLYSIESDNNAWNAGILTRCEESFDVMSGEIMTFDVIKVPLYDESHNRKGLLTIGRDITQQKAAETMLLRKEKLSVVGELAAGIAHEIRNPLTSIKGFVQLMKETKSIPQEHFDIVLTELERINQIVSEMLVLSKPQMKIFNPFKLKSLIDHVLKLTSHEALLYGIDIEVINKIDNPTLYGDSNQLIQVFINIIKNSIDAMPKGGKIIIIIEKNNDEIEIFIKDTGAGIPQERLDRIGEPFFTLKEKGMGLGLTISNKIIHEHKGRMDISSEIGQGTVVKISLPIYDN
ncbi:ATP-binding protein [Bacillus sp. PS06]|uniref:ATP-binding protein n=1 Tax=Bacillus sp. PS06 TaxID=2764176 RepID=UPI00177F939C|nr:ATP-binding protein [Bacillus sp. PS06]MBD8068510.1 PAS domain-containing protein [Bacillus sp. PS06]